MKISYSWLKEYIFLKESPEKIGEMLTDIGLEVEYITPFESVKGGLKDLVVGETLTCEKHPNADRLWLASVDTGESIPYQIVCGAPNIAAGQKVIVARPGTVLYPLRGKPFTIKKAKIRGEYSQGMICSEEEIGLMPTQEGIITLPEPNTPNGTPAAQYYNIQTDYIFEIGLTPNRGDATSHIGVARDLKALTGRPVQWPSIDCFAVDQTQITIDVDIINPEACWRYSAVTISDITIKDSPEWIQKRLKSMGLTPINNIVDATNYVCYELGQPLHAFDADQITGNKVIVQTAAANTSFNTLDGKTRKLTDHDLMICNAKEPMCIAGVLGGASHSVTQHTKSIFLESACFDPVHIQKTVTHHQIKTDASFRFERGIDLANTVFALKRAAALIKEIAGGFISSDIVDICTRKPTPKNILVKYKNITQLIGKKLKKEKITTILESLDMSVKENQDGFFTVSVPPYRVGIECEVDIVEEVLRIYGFDRINYDDNIKSGFTASITGTSLHNQHQQKLSEMLAANGYHEIITGPITRKSYLKKYPIMPENQSVQILNAPNEEQSVLRHTMLFTGLEVCAHNIHRKQKDLKLFEWGKTYQKNRASYKEKKYIALYLTGNFETANWQNTPRPISYFHLAQQISNILEKCNLNHRVESIENDNTSLFEYSMRWVYDHTTVGQAGKISRAIERDFGVKQDIFYAEFDADWLFCSIPASLSVKSISKYPEVHRDISLVLDSSISFKDIRELALKTEKKYIKELRIFDVYEGKAIPKAKKAYGLSFILSDPLKTLEDRDIDRIMQSLMTAFEKEMKATIRKEH